jgi:hypothetical protein
VQLVNKVQSNQMELSGQNIVVDNRKLSFVGVTMSAVIGGTAEKLGGGKPVRPGRGGFANGAVTGAYVMMFNHLQEPNEQNQYPTTEELERDFANEFRNEIIERFVENPEYIAHNADILADNLLSIDLNSDKHVFSLRATDVRIKVKIEGSDSYFYNKVHTRVPNIYSEFVPSVLNPGITVPISIRGMNNKVFEAAIRYQIVFPF